MLGIGEMARTSGLTVSALRFYDGAGVLVPAAVDPVNGYRWYGRDQVRAARVVAALRRVGMPLADIARAVRDLHDPAAVRPLLDRHLRRLEDGLADARVELSRVHHLLEPLENTMTVLTLGGAALAAALDAVRFAAGDDPQLPMLRSVLFDAGPEGLTVVATDRYRLAVATAAAEVDGPATRSVAPLSFADAVRGLAAGEPVTLRLGERLVAESGGRRVEEAPLDVDYPDHRRLLPQGGRPVAVAADQVRAALAGRPEVWREHEGTRYPVAILGVDQAGALRVAGEDEWRSDAEAHVAVNREFLLQALDAGGAGQLTLELDGPLRPLAVRTPGGLSMLMPVRA